MLGIGAAYARGLTVLSVDQQKNILVIADICKNKAITTSVVIMLPVDVLAPHGSRPSSVTMIIMFCCQVANFGASCGTIGGHCHNLWCRQ